MITAWFNEYKWFAVAILFLAYSVGVWNVSADVKENEYLAEKIRLSNHIIQIQEENTKLSSDLSTALAASLTKQQALQTQYMKDLTNALSKSTVYVSCRNTDSVRELYKRKLETIRRPVS
jgi:uncharacterized membrane protein